jgi:RNA polymerase sigma-70 factor (ECF subfamily)
VEVAGPQVGVEGSFEEMYRRELPAVIAVTVAMTGSREVGVELAHEAMTRAYGSWSKVRSYDRPGAWVRRVAINLALDNRRRQRREQAGLDRLRSQPSAASSAEPTGGEFWAAVRALPDRQRAAVCLYYLEDLAVADVAAVLDVSTGAVKTALFKARRTLAARLGLTLEEEDR